MRLPNHIPTCRGELALAVSIAVGRHKVAAKIVDHYFHHSFPYLHQKKFSWNGCSNKNLVLLKVL